MIIGAVHRIGDEKLPKKRDEMNAIRKSKKEKDYKIMDGNI